MTPSEQKSLLTVRRIGVVRSPFAATAGTPIQPAFAQGALGEVVVDEPYVAALDDLEGFDRIWLLYWFDRASPFVPRVVPFRDTRERGLFATRAPCRPNPVGLSAVRLLGRSGCTLQIADVDLLDETPLLDIKPYVARFDAFPDVRSGWHDEGASGREKADKRFARPGPCEPGE
jgi:tRNA-Thr(GGU) m(6)t(6)A37 methyltransferase TsaA